jgi:hypothetical protein
MTTTAATTNPAMRLPRDEFDTFESVCRANTAGYHRQAQAHGFLERGVTAQTVRESTSSPSSMSSNEPITVFHTREWIPMSLYDLASTMQRATRCNNEAALVALVLACRYGTTTLAVTRHMMHRLYVAALQLALKAHNDEFYTNAVYGKVAGVTNYEMNRLELALIKGLAWRCCVLAPQGTTVHQLCAMDVSHAAVVIVASTAGLKSFAPSAMNPQGIVSTDLDSLVDSSLQSPSNDRRNSNSTAQGGDSAPDRSTPVIAPRNAQPQRLIGRNALSDSVSPQSMKGAMGMSDSNIMTTRRFSGPSKHHLPPVRTSTSSTDCVASASTERRQSRDDCYFPSLST